MRNLGYLAKGSLAGAALVAAFATACGSDDEGTTATTIEPDGGAAGAAGSSGTTGGSGGTTTGGSGGTTAGLAGTRFGFRRRRSLRPGRLGRRLAGRGSANPHRIGEIGQVHESLFLRRRAAGPAGRGQSTTCIKRRRRSAGAQRRGTFTGAGWRRHSRRFEFLLGEPGEELLR